MRGIKLSLVTMIVCGSMGYGEVLDLGTINVDSTTIDDRFDSKKTEVSNTITVNGEKIDKAHGENIQQALNSIPGLTTEIQSGDSLKLHIRGVENQRYMGEKPRVAVVIDGVPVFERTGRVNIDLDNIDSIKVIKGGASYLFVEDALSGAIIITTKKGTKNTYNSVAYERGSFGYEKELARAGYSDDKINASLQISQRKSDGYWEDSDYKSKYLNSKVQYQVDDTSDLTFGVELSDREKDSHGTVKGVTQATINPQSLDDGTGANRDYSRMYDVGLQKYFLTYSKSLDEKSNLLVNLYQYNDDTSFVSSPIKYDTAGKSVTDPDAYGTQNNYFQIQRGLKSEYRTSFDKFATMFGVDIRDNYYENKAHILQSYASKIKPKITVVNAGTVTQNDETDENVYALYGEAKYALNDKLTQIAS